MNKPWLKEFEEDLARWRPRWQAVYDEGVPHNFDYPDLPLKSHFNYWAEKNPEKPYLIIGDTTLSYGVSNSMARRLANALLDLGVVKGDRVAIMAPNVPQYVIALQACFKIGAIEVPSNPLYTVTELTKQFNDSGTETVVVMASFADKAITIMKDNNSTVKRVVAFQLASSAVDIEKGPGIFDFNEIIAAASDKEPDIEVKSTDIAKLQYTGGTTGIPKGCVHTNTMLYSQAIRTTVWCSGAGKLVPYEKIRTLCAIPINHIYGYNANVNICLFCGATMVLVPQPTPDNILEAVNKHEPNIWAAVPAMIIGLINHPEIGKSKIGSIKGIFSGSAPLAVETLKRFEELSGGRIFEGYGLSETINILTVNPVFTKRKYGSCGTVWPDTDLLVVDVETGTKVIPRGELGELIARGPQVISEYWQNPEETANAVRDGWFYTGDIVRMDEEGFVFIADRKKDMIIASGFNVYPRDVDEVVFSHPKVLEACTIGVPDSKRGETVKVFVVLRDGEEMTKDEVVEFCREKLAPYKVPKLVEFIDAVPRTSVGKADRKVLQAWEKSKMEAAAQKS